MTFDSAGQVLSQVTDMLLAQQSVMRNRTLINKLFNGDSPFTEAERRAENLRTNINFLEATRIASNATNQIANAFGKSDRYFTVRLDTGPARMRAVWSDSITKHINHELKRSRAYKSAKESAYAQVVLHGPGPLAWKNRRSPCPSTAGVDDVVIPSGTLTSMENLDRFGVYRELTWNQLYEMTHGKGVDPGWNMEYVNALLKTIYKQGTQPIYQGNRWMFPEKMSEDVKEGSAQMTSSSLPKMLAWDFFYRSDDNGKWTRKMVLDYASITASGELDNRDEVVKNPDFIYQKEDYAADWQEIVHWYIGNCSNVAPHRYYSVRSVGYLLYGVCMIQNKLRNRLYDHLFQSLLTLFRNVSDDNREKLGMIDLQNFGVMPDGLSMVPAGERHTADWELIMMGLNQGRQLMAESSQSFVPDMAGGPQREMTATETLVRQNTSITLTSAVLNQLGDQSVFEYREVCRRFCIPKNPDPMAKRFRENIQKDGVPLDVLDCEAWDILPELTVGGGNKFVELSVTQALMQEIFPLADPDGQRIIARRRYLALTDNPEEAMSVIPEAPAPPSDDIQYAQLAFAVLSDGMPFLVKEGVNHIAYTGMLLQLMQVKMQQIQQLLGQPSGLSIVAEGVAGLMNVAQHCAQEIQKIGQAEQWIDLAKNMMSNLAEMVKVLQEMGQKVQEMSAQSQPQLAPETQAKIQTMVASAQTKNQIDLHRAQQRLQQKEIGWLSENDRRNATTAADIERKRATTETELEAMRLKSQATAGMAVAE